MLRDGPSLTEVKELKHDTSGAVHGVCVGGCVSLLSSHCLLTEIQSTVMSLPVLTRLFSESVFLRGITAVGNEVMRANVLLSFTSQ